MPAKIPMISKVIFGSCFLLFLCTAIHAQNQRIADSLKVELNNSDTPSSKLKTYPSLLANEGNPLAAMAYAKDYLNLALELEHEEHEATAWGELSIAYQVTGQLSEAVEAVTKAQKIYRKLNHAENLAFSYAQLAMIQSSQGLFDSSIRSYTQALNIYQQLNNTSQIILCNINLGEAYRLNTQLDSAVHYFKQSLVLNETLQDSVVVGLAMGNLGMVYHTQARNEEALVYLNQSVRVLEALGDLFSVAVYLFEIGGIEADQGKAPTGEEKMLRALKIANKGNLKEQIRDFSQGLSAYYEEKGDLAKSLEFQRQFQVYRDSLINAESIRKIEQIKYQYEADQQEAEISLITQISEQRRDTMYLLAGGVLLFIGLALMLYKNNTKIKLINGRLQLREKEKEVLLQELNHRTKNNLQMISSLLHLQSAHLESKEAIEAVEEGISRVESLTLLHQKLYNDNCMQIDTKEYLKELIQYLQLSYAPHVKVNTHLTPLALDVKLAIPLALIVNELVTNAIKYGISKNGKEGCINVVTSKEENKMRLIVADEGEGLSQADGKESSSFGLQLVHSLVSQLKGDLELDIKHGTQWQLTFQYG